VRAGGSEVQTERPQGNTWPGHCCRREWCHQRPRLGLYSPGQQQQQQQQLMAVPSVLGSPLAAAAASSSRWAEAGLQQQGGS